jgi:hypothetical protein
MESRLGTGRLFVSLFPVISLIICLLGANVQPEEKPWFLDGLEVLGLSSLSVSPGSTGSIIQSKEFNDPVLPILNNITKKMSIKRMQLKSVRLDHLVFGPDSKFIQFRDLEIAFDPSSGKLVRARLSKTSYNNGYSQDLWNELYYNLIDTNLSRIDFPDSVDMTFRELLMYFKASELAMPEEIYFYLLRISSSRKDEEPLLSLNDSAGVWIVVSKFLDHTGAALIDSLGMVQIQYSPRLEYRIIHLDSSRSDYGISVAHSVTRNGDKFPPLMEKRKKVH